VTNPSNLHFGQWQCRMCWMYCDHTAVGLFIWQLRRQPDGGR